MTVYPTPPVSPSQQKRKIPKPHETADDESKSSGDVSSTPRPPPTVRYTVSKPAYKDKVLANIQFRTDIESLKTLMGLSGGQCGALTHKATFCKRLFRAENKHQIDDQILMIKNFESTVSELESELDKLAKLVHCHQHDHGHSKESRIDDWVATFAATDDVYGVVFPIQRQLKKAIGQFSPQCIGTTTKNQRCKRKTGGQNVQNCTKAMNVIVKPEIFLDDKCLDTLLGKLAAYRSCQHHTRQSQKMVASWKSSIAEIRDQAELDVLQSINSAVPERNSQTTRSEIRQIAATRSSEKDEESVSPESTSSNPNNSLHSSPGIGLDPIVSWQKTFDTSAFEIIAKGGQALDSEASFHLIRSEIMKPLDLKDQASGWLYLYEVEGNKGYVKIGYTTRSLETRHEEWKFDCNRKLNDLYPNDLENATIVPCARRTEALCHAELDHCRVRIYCHGCLRQHTEWFEVSTSRAIDVIEKWSRWLATEPYQSANLRSGAKWVLKRQEQVKTRSVKDFMKGL